ncbi:cation transporter [Arcanobacterium canis]|uniref:Cation transporter n=1 Tax=Arcanobacterium canis TaxID=999183 RepID=A0ABY8FYY8_9ACTO|nr:cation transporter [Arcanobacterium canis]WFM83719.1 cation transporter [Arcanobacterium canis]
MNLRQKVAAVAAINGVYFLIEVVVASVIGSVSLFADSVDFFEDTAINLLVFVALAWPAARRRVAGRVLAGIILLPALAALTTAVIKIIGGATPSAGALTWTAVGALAANLLAAWILIGIRHEKGSLVKGAWLAARNDAIGNIAIIGAGIATFVSPSPWWDIAVGVLMGLINLRAAAEVWEASEFEGNARELLEDN